MQSLVPAVLVAGSCCHCASGMGLITHCPVQFAGEQVKAELSCVSSAVLIQGVWSKYRVIGVRRKDLQGWQDILGDPAYCSQHF